MNINRGRLGEMDRHQQPTYSNPEPAEPKMTETTASSRLRIDGGEIPPFLRKIKRDRN